MKSQYNVAVIIRIKAKDMIDIIRELRAGVRTFKKNPIGNQKYKDDRVSSSWVVEYKDR